MSWFKNILNTGSSDVTSNEVIDPFNASPERTQEFTAQTNANQELNEMEAIEQEREKDEQAQADQLVVVHSAKVKMGPHLGEFKVLQNVPTTQGKLTGTIVEKTIANFTFYDGFQLMSILGDWQNYGSYKVQDNEVLIKKSTLQVMGKMPGNTPPETGVIEIIDPGQINIPESVQTEGASVPEDDSDSEFKLESTYIHDYIKDIAVDMISKFDKDNTGVVYMMYKSIADGELGNPEIIVTKIKSSSEVHYDKSVRKIIVSEDSLLEIHTDNDRKINLIAELTKAYGEHINAYLEEKLNIDGNVEAYDYELFRFDAKGESTVIIAKMESPSYVGDLDIIFPKPELKKEEIRYQPNDYDFRQERGTKGGPNPGNFEEYSYSGIEDDHNGPGDDPPFNMGMKFSFSLGGGFSASLYAGVSYRKNIGDFGAMASFNAALTYYGHGTSGTSYLSRNLVTLSGTPALTLGYKTGNALNMNLFNQYSGSGVNNPFEYAFTWGATGILSSGRVTSEYDENGNRKKDEYNKFDTPHRHQIVGGASAKIGNFMISSYNDIKKMPLFFGMDSDQYWSAGVNMQAKLGNGIHMAYAFDLYYGKSNNENPYNRDKIINGQNYDHQRLFDLLLNRGQETFTTTDANGIINTRTRFGYGTFWPSNSMHNAIDFPSEPKKPEKPIEKSYKNQEKYNEAKEKYEQEIEEYKESLMNYKISLRLKPNSTFHHLYVVYKDGSRKPNWGRIKLYLEADIPKKELQEIYREELKK